jgi:hypothetical protein
MVMMYLVGVVAVLCLVPLRDPSVSASGERAATIGVMVDSRTTARHGAGLVGLFAFAAGALMYYSVSTGHGSCHGGSRLGLLAEAWISRSWPGPDDSSIPGVDTRAAE